MKAKFEVGADIDFLTRDELRAELSGWLAEISRGVRFRAFTGTGTVAGGVWQITSDTPGGKDLGPAAGILWSVTGLIVSGSGYSPAADTYSVYLGDVSAARLQRSAIVRDTSWDVGGLVLTGPERLALAGVGTGAGTEIVVSGRAVEVPIHLGWQLI
jgi:hypothetical protein